uniref:DNA-directed RNA polymerase RpoA/D/Rpb3-type domain-containing protein n=1 Tax=Piliocolobus tephrosceles TaxID=591936 RepID=A0A8C9H180_9PRIM
MKSVKMQDNFVRMGIEGPRNVNTTNFYGSYFLSEDEHFFNIKEFEEKLKMKIIKNEENLLILEIQNLNVSIANALRRIMISEVPTVAIEKVNIFQNTGIIADEILCHRLGLIPFKINPDLINYKEEDEAYNSFNCVCFKLHVKFNKKVGSNINSQCVYSKELIWVPLNGEQKKYFEKDIPKVVDDNILITKLGSGQEIELICFLEKGTGKTHAKWSPVCTAVYKMYPLFKFDVSKKLTNDEKKDLVNLCPKHVFDLEDSDRLIVKNPLKCSSCRACIEKYPSQVSFEKVKNHFIFTVESTGSITSAEIFRKALFILRNKINDVKDMLG